MSERAKKYLYDIYQSINSIDEFLDEKGFESFHESKIIRRAIESEIIGEAVNRLLKLDDPPEISNARRIVDLRNYIIHAYDTVEEEFYGA